MDFRCIVSRVGCGAAAFALTIGPARGADPTPSDYEFPRLCLGSDQAKDWLGKPGYGLAFLYQFDQIYGSENTDEVYDIKQAAIADGRADWANRVQFIFNTVMQSTDGRRHRPFTYDWELPLVRQHVQKAIDAAAYYNLLQGTDWRLLDIHGDPVKTWSDQTFALNSTPSCPLGTWNGKVMFDGNEVDLGSAVGLTYYQWLAGPFTETVLCSPASRAPTVASPETTPHPVFIFFRDRFPTRCATASG